MSRETPAVNHGSDGSRSGRGVATSGVCQRLAGAARAADRFLKDARGMAAVEFAFIAPVMLFMLVAVVDVTRAVAIDRRVSVVTNMIADLVARETQLTANDVNAIYEIASEVMAPYDTSKLDMSIIPVMSSPTNANSTLVYPSTTNRPSYHAGTTLAKCHAYPLTQGLLKANESVIVVESKYLYEPLWAGYVFGSMNWEKTAIAKPRKSLCIAFDGATCTTTCFAS